MCAGSRGARAAAALMIIALAGSMFIPTSLSSLGSRYSPLLKAAPRVLLLTGGPLALNGEEGVLLIPPAYSPYLGGEVSRIRGLASSGWTIIVLCGPGFERTVAEALGFAVSPRPLRQYGLRGLLIRYRGERLETPPLYAVEALRLGASIIASAPYSWIDYNENGIYDPGEELGSHAVALSTRMGRGEVIVIAAPSLNPFRDAGGWSHMVLSIVRDLGGNRTMYIDVSKQPRPSATVILAALHLAVHRHAALLVAATYLTAGIFVARLMVEPKHKAWRPGKPGYRVHAWGIMPRGSSTLNEAHRRSLEALWVEEV